MTTPASAEPTEAEFAIAHDLVKGVLFGTTPGGQSADAIARALASQRAEIVARYEKVAEELDLEGNDRENRASDYPSSQRWELDRALLRANARRQHDAAHRIREAAPK